MIGHVNDSTTSTKRRPYLAALLVSIACTLIVWMDVANAAPPTERQYSFAESEQGVMLQAGGKPVYFFQIATRALDGRWPRSHYVHPLYDPRGKVVTEDFPEDHGHHRGIFWAWHQLKLDGDALADPWVCKGIRWTAPSRSRLPQLAEPWQPAKRHPAVYFSSDARSAELLVIRDWTVNTDGKQTPVVEDCATITLHAPESNEEGRVRRLDFAIELRALLPGITIGGSEDVKGYGGFSTRIAMSPPMSFFGKAGKLEPETGAVDAGEWLAMRRDAGEASEEQQSTAHVSVLCHPDNPGSPTPWILRNKRSMQNAAWPGREPFALAMDKATSLKYRLLIHTRPWSAKELSTEWKKYQATELDD